MDAETDYRSLSAPTVYDPVTGIPIPNANVRVTQDNQSRTTQPIGRPVGLVQDAVMPLAPIGVPEGLPVALLSVSSNGTTIITATCPSPHGLVANQQVSVDGLASALACGFYNVTVISATAFSWMTNVPVPAAPLLTPETRIITAKVGIPLGYDQIPQTGP